MKLLEKYLVSLDIPYTQDTLDKFQRYYELLIEWNAKFNLTTITDKIEVIIKHFADSLYGYKYIIGRDSVVDVGTGAGFPSIPLAIVLPEVKFTLVDSLNKRVNFLNVVIDELGLNNCTSIHSRAEDLATNYRNHFDVAVARAVASLPTLLEYLVPLVRINGITLCYKAMNIEEEIALCINATRILNVETTNVDNYTILDTDYIRSLVVFKVTNACKKIYPRGGNKPKTNPL